MTGQVARMAVLVSAVFAAGAYVLGRLLVREVLRLAGEL